MPDKSDTTEREDRIRRRAHELWQQAGEPEGQDARFWREAEQEIERGEGQAPPARPPTAPVRDDREPPIQRDDPAGPPVGTPRLPRR